MRVFCSVALLTVLFLPTIAAADSPQSPGCVVDIDHHAFPVRALSATAMMDAPQVLSCRAAVSEGRYQSLSAVIVDGDAVAVVFLSPAGTLVMHGEAAMVTPASLGIDLWPRVSRAVDAVTKVFGDYSQKLAAPLPGATGPDGDSLMDELRTLMVNGLELGWRFRECLIDLPYDLAREVLKSQVPPEFSAAVDAVIDGIRLFQAGSRSREVLDARPALRQPVYEQIVSGLNAGRDVLAVQAAVLRVLSLE